jgi:hypothetical protein
MSSVTPAMVVDFRDGRTVRVDRAHSNLPEVTEINVPRETAQWQEVHEFVVTAAFPGVEVFHTTRAATKRAQVKAVLNGSPR